MKKSLLTLSLVLFFLPMGCSLYKKPEIPTPSVPKQLKYSVGTRQAAIKKSLPTQWWTGFHDPRLDRLVQSAFQKNYNYQITLKNIEAARTYVTQYVSGLWPQVNLNANGSRNKFLNIFGSGSVNSTNSNNNNSNNLLFTNHPFNLAELYGSVSYELDVWNQIGNTVSQAKADVLSSEANSRVAKLTLLNTVVATYFQIATLNANLDNFHSQTKVAQEILRLTETQEKSGLIDASSVDDAKNQLEMIRSNLEALRKQNETQKNLLAYLLGEYPERFNYSYPHALKVPHWEQLLPAELPSQIMTQRPDIQLAFSQALSAGYIEKQNLANFFPAFNIMGTYGYGSTILAHFFSATNIYWNYGLSALQAVFDYKLRQSEYQRAKVQYEAAILNYKNTVVNAFQEVDSALVSYQQDAKTLKNFQNQWINWRDKLALAHSQYQAGLTDYTSYLTTKLGYLQSQYNLNNQQLSVVSDLLRVYKTLGLGLE